MTTTPHSGTADSDTGVVARARATVMRRARELNREELAEDSAIVMTELATNAILHGGGFVSADIRAIDGGLRVEVRDPSRVPPILGRPSGESLTGRGLRLVSSISSRWGADGENGGKVVWAEITGSASSPFADADEDELLAMWDDEPASSLEETRYHVELGDVPTDLLLAAKSHVDDVVRESTLASAGAESGMTAEIPPHLSSLLSSVVGRFADARLSIKRQALDAAHRGDRTTRLALDLPASAAVAAEEYIEALDELDAYCRARRLLTLETPPQHRVFRHWYIEELVRQLRSASAGETPAPAESFVQRVLREFDRATRANAVLQQAARLYAVVAALATADSPEAVSTAALTEGVAALGASGGGLLLATDADRLFLPAAVGYDEEVVARLRDEPANAELPAAAALRTGDPVWLESRSERDLRFPELAALEATTVALCAVPLEVRGRRIGALRFSFREARLFDEDERRFVMALAGQTAQALDRAQLQLGRIDVSRRLQRSLLPPQVPSIPGLDVAAIYHPFGDGLDVGGDFYDIWPIGGGRFAFAIGDASGTGPEAAAMTALVRHTMRALAISQKEPSTVISTLNTALLEAAQEPDGERFCTAIFGTISQGHRVALVMASGGHPPPFLRRADGRLETLPSGGMLLGLFRGASVATTRVELQPGDTLVLVTDGVLEAHRDAGQFGPKGVEAVLQAELGSAGTVATAIEQAVLRHTGGSLNDDLAAVVLQVLSEAEPAGD